MNNLDIKKLNPKVFEMAMNYVVMDKTHSWESSGICLNKGICAAIFDVIHKIYTNKNTDDCIRIKNQYTEFLISILDENLDKDNFWWEAFNIVPESQTARIIALQLAVIRLREMKR
jgi:hypothetical protein